MENAVQGTLIETGDTEGGLRTIDFTNYTPTLPRRGSYTITSTCDNNSANRQYILAARQLEKYQQVQSPENSQITCYKHNKQLYKIAITKYQIYQKHNRVDFCVD